MNELKTNSKLGSTVSIQSYKTPHLTQTNNIKLGLKNCQIFFFKK